MKEKFANITHHALCLLKQMSKEERDFIYYICCLEEEWRIGIKEAYEIFEEVIKHDLDLKKAQEHCVDSAQEL